MATPNEGAFVNVRGRPWLVDSASNSAESSFPTLSLSSIADDAPGETLEVIWDAEVGASIIDDSGWEIVGLSAPDSAEMLAAQDAFAASQAGYEQSNKEHEAKVAEAARARAAWEAKVKACNAGDRAACAP